MKSSKISGRLSLLGFPDARSTITLRMLWIWLIGNLQESSKMPRGRTLQRTGNRKTTAKPLARAYFITTRERRTNKSR
jgi:hypothetical protein